MPSSAFEVEAGPLHVALPSGAPFEAANQAEAEHVEDLIGNYISQYALTNVSDLGDLDRLIIFEALTYRWGVWLLRRADYDGKPIDEAGYQKKLNEFSSEIRQMKKLLGIDKVARERTRGEGSVPHFIGRIVELARRFGIHRETQLDKALELMNELIGMVQLARNLDEKERRELRVTDADIVTWCWDRLRVEYEAIDEYFREHDQRYWVQEL